MSSSQWQYLGDGSRQLPAAPDYEPVTRRDPAQYHASPELRDAVNVAILLGMPLLVTGDPGTGKTELAHSIAWEMGLPGPIIFNAKTSSTSQELFYRYDALKHFQAAHVAGTAVSAASFIEAQALGIAILLALPAGTADAYLPTESQPWKKLSPLRSVVLIDEIDKAPRDLPNDILNEIDRMSFRIKETSEEFTVEGGLASPHRPIVIMTSNSEKHLPDAFLRRCVFFHIEFPDDTRLEEILTCRLTLKNLDQTARQKALKIFREIRKLDLSRKPATAELLNWMVVLDRQPTSVAALRDDDRAAIAHSYNLLVKNADDVKKVHDAFGINRSDSGNPLQP